MAKGKGKDKGKQMAVAPYPMPGKGLDKDKGKGKESGPPCKMSEFIQELIAGGLPGGDQDPTMNCIYVGGLPADTGVENVYEIFATFGGVPPKGIHVEQTASGDCVGWATVQYLEPTSA